MRRLLPSLALLVAALAGCDSAGVADDPPSLVGTWRITSGANTTAVTVREAQTVPDRLQPGTGGFTLSGAATGTLRYYGGRAGAAEVFRASAPDAAAPGPTLRVQPGAGATLSVPALGREYTADAPPALRFDGTTVVLEPLALGGGAVTVGGTLRLATRALAAGTPTAIDVLGSGDFYEQTESTVTFRPDGTVSLVSRQGGAVVEDRTGTWTDLGDRTVRIDVAGDVGTLRASFEGGTLTLQRTADACPPDAADAGAAAACLRGLEAAYGIAAGTLASAESRLVNTLVPVTAPATNS